MSFRNKTIVTDAHKSYDSIMRIMASFIVVLAGISVLPTQIFGATNCSSERLLSMLQKKIILGEAHNIQHQSWWNRCPLSVRKAVWEAKSTTTKTNTPWQQGTSIPLPYLSIAKEFEGLGQWFNGQPFNVLQQRGKVLVVQFWTYGCINCIRTLPAMKSLWKKFGLSENFQMIGIHTPEFAYEKSVQNLDDAIKRFGLLYPIAQDNEFETWNVFGNQYWPAIYVVDKQGYIRYTYFGESDYKEAEKAIVELMQE